MSNETMKDGERAAFEAWILTGGLGSYPDLSRDALGDYDDLDMQPAWLSWQARAASPQSGEKEFKNFHRLLCERFGYVHDDRYWKRDQLSLIELIAKWRDQFEFLDVQNHTARQAMRKIMARLTELLDEDRFAEIEEIVRSAGVAPHVPHAGVIQHVALEASNLLVPARQHRKHC